MISAPHEPPWPLWRLLLRLSSPKQLLEKLGLSWHPLVEGFLSSSTAKEGSYFRPYRLPLQAAHGWRDAFDEQDEVLDAISETRAMELFS